MRLFRYLVLVLVFTPALALAQEGDSIHVTVTTLPGELFQSIGADFGAQFTEGEPLGPLPLVLAEPREACEPITNTDAMDGAVALVSRGSCAYVLKAMNAADAGAAAVIVFNADDTGDPNALLTMIGDCGPDVCSAPAAFVSQSSSLVLVPEAKFGTEVVIDPIRIEAPPPPSSFGVHDTGVITMSVFDYGFIGTNARLRGSISLPDDGPLFTFISSQDTTLGGLHVSTVLVAQGGTVNTNPYTEGPPEFTNVTDVTAITPPFPFDQAFETSYRSEQLGVLVRQRSFSRIGDPFVILDLEVENESGAALDDVYVGIFADWDVDVDGDGSDDDLGGVNEDLAVPYVFDEDGAYYGVTAVSAPLSGYSTEVSGLDGNPDDATDEELWTGLTEETDPLPGGTERAAVTGTGPYDLAAGERVTVRFAYVAGEDEVAFFDNVSEVRLPTGPPPAIEAVTPEGVYRLESVYPNPVSARATVGFTLPRAQAVRLAVFDVLGRKVAVLADEVRPAGEQALRLDASALPSGVYLVRLETTGVDLTQRLTVVR